MKTSEFKQAVDKLGFETSPSGNKGARWLYILESSRQVAVVDVDRFMKVDTRFVEFGYLTEWQQVTLGALLFEYASTPLDEREPERKWYIKCPITGYYLNRDKDEDNRFVWTVSKRESNTHQTKFTQQEIEAYEIASTVLKKEEVTE